MHVAIAVRNVKLAMVIAVAVVVAKREVQQVPTQLLVVIESSKAFLPCTA